MADQYLWTPADGSPAIDLTDEAAGYSVEADGTRGLRSVTYEFVSEKYAGIDGDTVRAVRAEPNRPSLALLVRASNAADFQARCRALIRSMRPKIGRGLLTITQPDGTSRTLPCYVESGLEGDEADEVTMPGRWWRVILKLYAPEPWWLGPVRPLSIGLGAPQPFFPIFPMRLAPSTVQGSFTIDLSDTDDPAWPVWTVIGPGNGLTLKNVTTNRTLTVNASVGAGDSLVIDTRPGHRSIRRGDGTNLMDAVVGDPVLWPLIEGVNEVMASMAGATVASRILGQFQPRYAGI